MNVRIAVSSRRAFAKGATLTALAALIFAAGPAVAAGATGTTPGNLPSSANTVHFQGIAPVGALFSAPVYTGSDAAHFCTGSVIASPHGGALRLATTHLPVPVQVVGYNDLQYDPDGNKPIECHALAFEETDASASWARFNCPNYQDGSSGGPWIIARTNQVMGVIGGYEQGGDSPNWSYSAIFDASTLAFYASVAF